MHCRSGLVSCSQLTWMLPMVTALPVLLQRNCDTRTTEGLSRKRFTASRLSLSIPLFSNSYSNKKTIFFVILSWQNHQTFLSTGNFWFPAWLLFCYTDYFYLNAKRSKTVYLEGQISKRNSFVRQNCEFAASDERSFTFVHAIVNAFDKAAFVSKSKWKKTFTLETSEHTTMTIKNVFTHSVPANEWRKTELTLLRWVSGRFHSILAQLLASRWHLHQGTATPATVSCAGTLVINDRGLSKCICSMEHGSPPGYCTTQHWIFVLNRLLAESLSWSWLRNDAEATGQVS